MLATLHAQVESSDTAEMMAETLTLGVICRMPTDFIVVQATQASQARDWSLMLRR